MNRILSIFLATILFLSLSACNRSSSIENNAANETSDKVVTSSVVLEESHANVADQSPEELIDSAMKVYSWFVMVPLEVDYNNKKQVDGVDWFKVKDDRYDTYEKLDNYLKTIFSSDIVNELWEYNVYKEINGYLYSLDGGRGANIFIEDVKYDVSEISDNKIVYAATVSYSKDSGEVENPKVLEFVREKINDNWVFTSFPYFW